MSDDRAHAVLGASSSDRWMACPGSLRLIALAPKEEPKEYAAEGTAAHSLAEMCLTLQMPASAFIYNEITSGQFTFQVDEEMAEAVQVYVNLVTQIIARCEAERTTLGIQQPLYGFERKFDLSWVHAGMFGTNDFCALLPQSRKLIVVDYKHGKGKIVDADDNSQLMYYALGALKDIPAGSVDEIELIIVQPRAAGNPIKRASYSPLWLETVFVERLREAAKATEAEDAPVVAGKHCTFCRAKGICPARHNSATSVMRIEKPYQLPEISQLEPEHLAKILEHKKDILDWLSAVEIAATTMAQQGIAIPEHKLVRSNKHRTFYDKEDAKTKLVSQYGDEVLKRELLGLGDLEKLLKKKLGTKEQVDEVMNSLVYEPEGDIVLAPAEDKRPAITEGILLEAVI